MEHQNRARMDMPKGIDCKLPPNKTFAGSIFGVICALDISDIDNPENTELTDTDLNIALFGTDAYNKL